MRRFILSLTILFLIPSLSACQKKPAIPVNQGVSETGRVIDITEMNGQEVRVEPGDVLSLSLKGESGSDFQWSIGRSTDQSYLSLKAHTVTGDPHAESGKFSSDWQFKVEKEGEFNILFVYHNPLVAGEEPEDTFQIKVISQKD